jgi:hypothetical protein
MFIGMIANLFDELNKMRRLLRRIIISGKYRVVLNCCVHRSCCIAHSGNVNMFAGKTAVCGRAGSK